MNTFKKLSKLFNKSKEINIDDKSKIIIMSDCHRSDNALGDNFYQNTNIFLSALNYYYIENYTYIELGDGDELWENNSLKNIIDSNFDVFELLSKFYKKNRFYMLYGNHDISKKNENIKKNILNNYNNEKEKKNISLFPNIEIYEGLILKYNNNKILLTHGHQGDFLNDDMWVFTKFLIRYLWHPLEKIGINNPINLSNSRKKRDSVEKKLMSWSKENKVLLVAGHTHKPVFSNDKEASYFNDGCCTNLNYITGIEINKGMISLVKWSIKVKKNRTLYVDKEVLNDPIKIDKYCKK